ncbi:hypothetical protein AGMMS49928_06020 [Spirochaetia bacterium]|nr:hypothetical protein AGMMS49928_06020 [Spirochaetia bacterium]
MKILYVALNINHHQVSFVKEIISIIGEKNFKYATLRDDEKQRAEMGFPVVHAESWIIDINSSYHYFIELFEESDIVICSIRKYYKLMYKRVLQNKLTFYFSERWFKTGLGKLRLLHPQIMYLYVKFRQLSKYPSFYYLAQGYYAALDFRFLRLCPNRILKFGYFTDVKPHASSNPVFNLDGSKINILWCGRFLKWKRIDVLVKAFSLFFANNGHSNVHLTLVGDGNIKKQVKKLLEKLVPTNSYTLLSSLKMDIVRSLMQQADIYVLPSDGYEGWGAVINEAMAESCVVVASDKIGGGKTMIEHWVNGFLFPVGDYKKLFSILYDLALNDDLRKQVVNNALSSINTLWSPKIAADRFYTVCERLLKNDSFINFESGPLCSIK